MDIRPYASADRDSCLAIFDSNTPEFFEPERRPAFAAFLDALPGPYFVIEQDVAIMGCGGYVLDHSQARLIWGMIGREWRRQGLGRFLLMFCLREITKIGEIGIVVVESPERSAPFLANQGFRYSKVTEQGVEMLKKLSVCT